MSNDQLLPDMTKQQATETKKRDIIEGKVMLRFSGYVEVGKHKQTYMGQESVKDKVWLIFEVFGKNYPLENGQPLRVTVKENYSLHEKANFKKLFIMMRNNDSEIKHMSQLLGKPFIANLYKYEMNGKTYPTLKGKEGYKIGPAVIEDPETGDLKEVRVPEMVGPVRRFIWALPDKNDWDGLFIDGQYSDGNSKNIFQNTISSALNYDNSYVQTTIESSKAVKHFQPKEAGDAEAYYLDQDIEF